jgi:hypothetical protein
MRAGEGLRFVEPEEESISIIGVGGSERQGIARDGSGSIQVSTKVVVTDNPVNKMVRRLISTVK